VRPDWPVNSVFERPEDDSRFSKRDFRVKLIAVKKRRQFNETFFNYNGYSRIRGN
jgi:hypothetical protein